MTRAFDAAFVPGRFFASETHRNAMAGIIFACSHRLPAAVLEGPAGTGKSAVLEEFTWRAAHCRAPLSPVLLRERPASAGQLCQTLAGRLGCAPDSPALQAALRRMAVRGVTPLLLLDEAHRFTEEVWAQVRHMTAWNDGGRSLLPVVLAGGPGLESLLPSALAQTLDVKVELQALTTRETTQYIEFLWSRVSGEKLPISAETLRSIAAASDGIPRIVNRLCRQALRIGAPPVRKRARKVLAMAQGAGVQYVAEGLPQ